MQPSIQYADLYSKEGGHPVKWVKPEFEVIDLCTEVTLYMYHR
jgi:hypothetical protein